MGAHCESYRARCKYDIIVFEQHKVRSRRRHLGQHCVGKFCTGLDANFDSYYELPGAVYIFERQSGSSSSPRMFTTKIHSNIGGNTYDMFGAAVAISGKYALIGAAGDRDKGDNAGAAYIFTRSDDSGEWEQRAKLVAYDGSQNDQFGFSVSISGDIAIVGAPYDDENGQESGSAYIYERSSATNEWVLSTKLTTTNGAQNDNFGRSVSINDNRALVGAFQKASGFGGSGIAYLFEKQSDTNTWTEVARLNDFEGIFSEFAAITWHCRRHTQWRQTWAAGTTTSLAKSSSQTLASRRNVLQLQHSVIIILVTCSSSL